MSAAPAFTRHVGVDYSGAQTPSDSLPGLRVYVSEGGAQPVEVTPPPSPRRYWSRRGIAEWLLEQLREDAPTLVGIDHAFSFAIDYFDAHGLPHDWDLFLDDFQAHWPTDQDIYVDFVREGIVGNGAARQGSTRWRRLTERRAGSAKSVFHFDVPGSVAKSTHSGLPWLRSLRRQLGERVHFWPFDGWDIPAGRSAIAEAYPALWSRGFENEGRTPDQHDAFSIAAWMSAADRDGQLEIALQPPLSDADRAVAMAEGWILGVSVATLLKGQEHLSRQTAPRFKKAMPESDNARVQELYAAIGHFIFAFSQLEFMIRHTLADALGLKQVGPDATADIVTSTYDFASLCRVTKTIFERSMGYEEEARKEIAAIINEYLALNDQERVPIAHGEWLIDEGGFNASHFARSKLERTIKYSKIEEVTRATEKAERLKERLIKFLIGPMPPT
jgi:hypothetical protein